MKRFSGMAQEVDDAKKEASVVKAAREVALQVLANRYCPRMVPQVYAICVVLKYYDIIHEICVLMRYIEGESLRDWNDHIQTDANRELVLAQVATFLYSMNCARIEHADLHLNNLMVRLVEHIVQNELLTHAFRLNAVQMVILCSTQWILVAQERLIA